MSRPNDDFDHALINTVTALCGDPRAQRIFLLATAGLDGAHAWTLKNEFRQLGVLHLLVLSGSQVSSLFGMVSQGFWMLGRLWGVSPGWRSVCCYGALLVVVLFCVWTGGSPPLVRATLWIASMIALPRCGFLMRCLMVLATQVMVLRTSPDDLSFCCRGWPF